MINICYYNISLIMNSLCQKRNTINNLSEINEEIYFMKWIKLMDVYSNF